MIPLARKIDTAATDVTHEDIGPLRACGLTDEEILDVLLGVAARCLLSKTLDATGQRGTRRSPSFPGRCATRSPSVGRSTRPLPPPRNPRHAARFALRSLQ